MRLILDYGGVLTARPRHVALFDALTENATARARLEHFARSTWFAECAIGLHRTRDLIAELAKVAALDSARVQRVLMASTAIDPDCLCLVAKLAKRHELYLISDSLPPYSDYIEAHLADFFVKLFLSDRVGLRKTNGLFEHAERAHPDLFARAVYIDDNEANLAYPFEHGATVLCVSSSTAFREMVRQQHWLG